MHSEHRRKMLPAKRRTFQVSGLQHYSDVVMDTMASQITSRTIVYATVYSDADQRKHQSSASLAFLRGIHRRPVNSPHKWPVTRIMFPFDDVIMNALAFYAMHQCTDWRNFINTSWLPVIQGRRMQSIYDLYPADCVLSEVSPIKGLPQWNPSTVKARRMIMDPYPIRDSMDLFQYEYCLFGYKIPIIKERPSYHYNRNAYTVKTYSYWNDPLFTKRWAGVLPPKTPEQFQSNWQNLYTKLVI